MDATISVSAPRGQAAHDQSLSSQLLSLVATVPMIRPEQPADAGAIETLLDAAFGPGRFAKVSERVRERAEPAPALSRVAIQNGELIGCCRLFHIVIGEAPALFLGPLAVAPQAQAGGLGQALVSAVLAAAGPSLPILLVGQPKFFARFGFTQVPDSAVIMPGPTEARRLQWLHAPEGLTGAVSAPRAAS